MQFTSRPFEAFGRKLAEVEIPTSLSFKTALVLRFARLLEKNGCLSPARRALAELCFDEALTNAMTHGNRLDSSKKVRTQLFCDDTRWGAIIEDEGSGFSPEDVQSATGEDLLREKGRGIMLMDGYLDALLYSEKGNRLMMIRHRDPLEEPGSDTRAEQTEKFAGLANAEKHGNVAVVELLAQRLSDENVDRFKSEVEAAMADSASLVFDLTKVRYISSSIIGALVMFYKRARARGGDVKLCGLQPPLTEALSMVGLERLMEVLPDRQSALKRLRGPS